MTTLWLVRISKHMVSNWLTICITCDGDACNTWKQKCPTANQPTFVGLVQWFPGCCSNHDFKSSTAPIAWRFNVCLLLSDRCLLSVCFSTKPFACQPGEILNNYCCGSAVRFYRPAPSWPPRQMTILGYRSLVRFDIARYLPESIMKLKVGL